MNEQTLKAIVAFNNLPETEEIKEIKKQYLNDEISSYELYCIALNHLEKL